MKRMFLGGILFIGGIIGICCTYISFACTNWDSFSDFVNFSGTGIMFWFVMSWLSIICGLSICIYEAYIKK